MDKAQLYNDAEEAMRLVLDGRQSSMWTALPGIVKAVDLAKMTCSVQPAIQGSVEDEDGVIQSVNLPLLVDVPIVFPGAGGFIITFPIASGDEVLIVMASRCIDAWWQSGGIQRPMEARMHDLSDGFAIPGPRSQPRVVSGISASALQIRNVAGTKLIEITASGINITGNVVVTGTLVANAVTASGISLTAHVHPVSVPSTPFSGPTGAPT